MRYLILQKVASAISRSCIYKLCDFLYEQYWYAYTYYISTHTAFLYRIVYIFTRENETDYPPSGFVRREPFAKRYYTFFRTSKIVDGALLKMSLRAFVAFLNYVLHWKTYLDYTILLYALYSTISFKYLYKTSRRKYSQRDPVRYLIA